MANDEARADGPRTTKSVSPAYYGVALTVLWTFALAASLGWLLHLQRQDEEAAAAITARVSYEADVKYLNWLSALGGLYVRTEEPFPPDPHFGGLPEHQVRLPDGSAVMPLTPIYVLRLVHELDIMPLEVSSSLRSLTPSVPEDEPDTWERKALGELAAGSREVAEIGVIDSETYLRLMRPLRLGRDCINCHDKAGFQEGALQGGISVTVPMDRPEEFGRRSDAFVYATHGMLWLLGVGLIGYGSRKLAARIQERDEALAAVSQERNFSDSVLETVGALVVVLDAEGRIVRFNRACERVTGYGFGEVRGRPVWDVLLATEDRGPFRERFARLRAEKSPVSHETPWVAAGGASRIIAWSDTPLIGAEGTVEHVIATGIDVTRARQTEAALVESEERYRGLVESSPDAVFVEQDERLVFANHAGARLLGAEHPGQLLGKGYLDFVHPDHRAAVANRFRLARDGGLPVPLSEETLVGLDGGPVETEVAAIPFRYQGQSAVQVIARDVSDRRRAEQALRDSEARYRALAENVELGITLITPDHRVVMSNAAQSRLFARHPGDFAGEHCYRVFQGRDSVCPECPGTGAMATGIQGSIETVRVRGDGTNVPVRIQAFPVIEPDGGIAGFIEVVEDITPLRRAEEERLQLEHKIQQTQKLESLGVLAGGIAHDFNNLLMGVLGNVDIALAKASPESPLRPYLLKIDGAAQRAAELTSQMLAYSGRGRFVVEPINLSRLVEELGYLLETVVSKKATLRYNLAPALPPVLADATQVRQVVMNLITNASDALGDRSGTVTVSTGVVVADRAYLAAADFGEDLAPGRYVYVEVTDPGCGMAPATRARVFDPFFTTKQTGRGLGLAAVLGIVRGHKGGLTLHSQPGRGTTFLVFFPASEARYADPSEPSNAATLPGADIGGKILVVDDDAMVREATRDMLEDFGFSVLTATDGVDGVEVLEANLGEVAAVILDMTMPRMNGEEALQEMRRIRPALPVVLCSGFNEQDVAERHVDEEYSRFLHKPYRAKDLLGALDAVLGAGPAGSGEAPAAAEHEGKKG